MTNNKVFKALADPTRRRVLALLREGARTAGEISDRFPVAKSTMSAHFSVLQAAGLIEAEKDGRVIYYRLKTSVLENALLGFAESLGIDATGTAGSRPKRARGALRRREA